MGKIAAELDQALTRRDTLGTPGATTTRAVAAGDGWSVDDVLCTFGPRDRPFEERHGGVCVAIVMAGAFAYRAPAGRDLLTPGALLLGNAGECFECGHRHGAGDRCLSFHFEPGCFERLAADAGIARAARGFKRARIPPLRASAPLIARACAGLAGAAQSAWDELAVELAVAALQAAADGGRQVPGVPPVPGFAASRVAQTVRLIDETPGAPHTLRSLARAAGLSEFHFLRSFERVTGTTPHQYVLRARLRAAALRVVDGAGKIVDIALDCGFNDLSNFNHAFRAEFGASPRVWRAQRAPRVDVPRADAPARIRTRRT